MILQIYRNIGKIPQVLSFPLLPNGFTFSVGIERFLFHTLVLEWRHVCWGVWRPTEQAPHNNSRSP